MAVTEEDLRRNKRPTLYGGSGVQPGSTPGSRALATTGAPTPSTGTGLVPVGQPVVTQGRTLTPAQVAAERSNLQATIPQTRAQRATTQFVNTAETSAQRLRTPAAAALGAAPAPAAAPAAVPQPSPTAARAPGALGRGLRAVGGRAGAVPLVIEAGRVAGAAQTGGLEAGAVEATKGAGRLAGASTGARLGAMVPGPPILKGATTLLGGAAGYIAGQEATDRAEQSLNRQGIRERVVGQQLAPRYNGGSNTVTLSDGTMLGSGKPESDPMSQARGVITRRAAQQNSDGTPFFRDQLTEQDMEALGAYRQPSAAGALASPVGSQVASQAGSQMGSQVGISGPQSAAANARKVIGTFSGERTGTRNVYDNGDVDPAAQAGGSFNVIPAYQGAAAALSAPAQGGGGGGPVAASIGGDSFVTQLDQQLAALGPLNMRGKRDLAAQLLGLKERTLSGEAQLGANLDIEGSRRAGQSAADQLRAQVDREQIAVADRASQRSARGQQQTVVGEDGSLYTLSGNSLTPVTGANGKPFRPAPTKGAANNELASKFAELVGAQLPPGATAADVDATVQALGRIPAFQQLAGTSGGDTPIGKTPDGKTVYRDAQGNTYTE